MTDLTDLVNAVIEDPKEHTKQAALADFLLERGDLRGEILRRYLETPAILNFPTSPEYTTHQQEFFDVGPHNIRLSTELSRGGDSPKVQLSLEKYNGKDHKHVEFTTDLSHSEARQLVDSLPQQKKSNGVEEVFHSPAKMHEFLSEHYGSDPRLIEGLNKALTDKSE